MALNLTNLFTALGRVANNAFRINTAQSSQNTPFDTLIGYSYVNPTWLSSLVQNYDALIRTESVGQEVWATTAQTILQAMVTEENPSYGTSLGSTLLYVDEQMQEQTSTVKECILTSGIVANPLNVGTPAVYVSLIREDGLTFQNTIAELGTLTFTDDSYTGTATVNLEPWQWAGAPNISSLGTGTPVGVWDWDWPQGSQSTVTGSNIDGAQEATASGNYLTNGAFESWTGTSPAVLDSWYLSGGAWGTDLRRTVSTTAGIDGGYCVEFIAGTATTEYLSQQFDSNETTGTDPTAGTTAALTPFKTYVFNVWLKADGVISAGVLTISLRDSSGTVINDRQGTANSTTIALAAHSTSWVAHQVEFRLPVQTPSVVRIRIAMTTALAGANLYMDYAAFAQPTQLYSGGPLAISFANPAAPVEAGPNPDSWDITFTNDRGGATYGLTWQNVINRLFRTPTLILPYAAIPTIDDGLISAGITFTTNVFILLEPTELTVSGSYTTVDCNTLPWTLQAVQMVSVFTDITSLAGKIEESTTGVGAWTDVSGGGFPLKTSDTEVDVITFTRTKRYIRYTYTIVPSGGSPTIVTSVSGGY